MQPIPSPWRRFSGNCVFVATGFDVNAGSEEVG
jgi:hypothetical protein